MTRDVLPRPTLLPGLARLWRDRHTLQLGLDPARAVLVEVADPATVRLLDLLDGTRSERAVLEQAAGQWSVAREAARTLIDTLRRAGLVVAAHTLLPSDLAEPARRRLADEAAAIALLGPDAPATPAQTLRRRAKARVVLAGYGRLAAPVATALAQAGVGHLDPVLTGTVTPGEIVGSALIAADVRRPRAAAIAEAIARAAPGTRTGPIPRGRADLVVQFGQDRPAELLAAGFAYRRQAHLLLEWRDGTPVIGPFVPAAGSPCLHCLDLHRRDRDPHWPELAAQLAADRRAEPCNVPTQLTAAGYAVGEILAFLDGSTPTTLGGAVEVSGPGRLRTRRWPPHPRCGCARRRSRRTAPSARKGYPDNTVDSTGPGAVPPRSAVDDHRRRPATAPSCR